MAKDYSMSYDELEVEENAHYQLTIDETIYDADLIEFNTGENRVIANSDVYVVGPKIIISGDYDEEEEVDFIEFDLDNIEPLPTDDNHYVKIVKVDEAPTLDGTVLVEVGSFTTRLDPEYFGIQSPAVDIEIDETLREEWITAFGDYYDGTTQNIILDGMKKSNLTFIEGDCWTYFGNGHLLDNSIEDTGEDFCVTLGDVVFLVTSEAGTHTFGLAYQVVNE